MVSKDARSDRYSFQGFDLFFITQFYIQSTFWNMNSSVWVVWAAQAVRKKSGFEFF